MLAISRRRSNALRAGLTALLLTACQHSMNASFGAGATAGAGAPSAASTSASSTEPPATSPSGPSAGPTGDTAALVGYTVEEATRRAREKGYTGNIEVYFAREFVAGCNPGTVCGVTPRLFEMLPGRVLTFYLNRELNIKTPD